MGGRKLDEYKMGGRKWDENKWAIGNGMKINGRQEMGRK